MNYRNIFWGFTLIVIGVLFTLQNFDVININWRFFRDLWPLLLIFFGINALVKNDSTSKLGVGLGIAFLLGFFVFLFFNSEYISDSKNSFEYKNDGENRIFNNKEKAEENNQDFVQEMDSSIRRAKLNFEGSAGSFELKEETNKFFEAKTQQTAGEYSLERINNGELNELNFKLNDSEIQFNSKSKNKVKMMLNVNPEWDMEFNLGAGSADLDLSKYKIKKMVIEAGASSLDLKLGDQSNFQEIEISMGASAIDIEIPKGAACQIKTDTGLSSTDFENFTKISEDVYQTENFSSSPNKIMIKLESGVSSISVKRY